VQCATDLQWSKSGDFAAQNLCGIAVSTFVAGYHKSRREEKTHAKNEKQSTCGLASTSDMTVLTAGYQIKPLCSEHGSGMALH